MRTESRRRNEVVPHVPAKRLFDVAVGNYPWFQLNEFEHMKKCSGCVDRFVHFVRYEKRDKGRGNA
jgi:hypothetical protein